MRILAVGDSFMSAEILREAFEPLRDLHEIRYAQIDAARVLEPASISELAIREYEGHPAELVELLDGDDIMIVHGAPITAEVLDAAPGLRLVGCARGGPVNVDVAAATERGVQVVSTPGKNAESVADLTLAFLVMLARGITSSQRFLLEGGQLGESAFEGAQFFGHDPYLDALPPGDVKLVEDLGELLRRADFVSLHARATPESERLFDADAFAAMKRGAWFINTARETLVHEPALLDALHSGQLAGAALDVVNPRPDGSRNPLLDLEQVVVTPHIAGATHETLARGARMLGEEIVRVAAQEPLRNVVKYELRPSR